MTEPQVYYMRAQGVRFDLAWYDEYRDCVCCEIDGPRESPTYTSYIAFDKRQRIIGVLVGIQKGFTWTSHGTLVRPHWRKLGVAMKLWEQMLQVEQPRSVYVTLVSDRGKTLVESLKQKYQAVHWEVYDDGARPLRRLKKRK